MRCPACGFEHNKKKLEDFDAMDHCRLWAHLFNGSKETLPTKEQFEAMQKEGFLPTHSDQKDGSGNKCELHYGHYGWMVHYQWPMIVEQIKKSTATD